MATACWASPWPRHLHTAERGAEGQLALRLNALVSKTACAQAARAIDVSRHVLLGKQARDDGAADSDNVLGDVMEALLGACFLEQGYEAARDRVLALWADALDGVRHRAQTPQKRAAGMGGGQPAPHAGIRP